MLRTFIAVQVLVPLILATLCPHDRFASGVILGVLSGQAALVGFWIAFGAFRLPFRLLIALPTLAWFMFVLMSRPTYNGWYTFILGLQLAVTIAVLLGARRTSRCVLSRAELETGGLPWQFRLIHLLMLMIAVPVLWGVVPLLARLPFLANLNIPMYVYLFLMAAGFAAAPLIGCWGVYGRGRLQWRVPGTALAIALIGCVMAYYGYAQFSSMEEGASWLLWSLTGAIVALLSFIWLKQSGYRIGRPLNSTNQTGTTTHHSPIGSP